MSKKYTGVIKNNSSISINFILNGKLVKRTLKLMPTNKNMLYAYNERCRIIDDIEKGSFDLQEYDNARSGNKITNKNNNHLDEIFSFYLEKYIEINSDKWAPATIVGYVAIKNRLIKEIGKLNIHDITPSFIKELFSNKFKKFTNKYKNHFITVIRGTIKTAKEYGVKLKFDEEKYACYKISIPEATPTEYDKLSILTKFKSESEDIKNAYIANHFIGLRPGEFLGLDLNDIDFEKKTIHIERAVTTKGQFKHPKSVSSERTILLSNKAIYHLKKIIDNRPNIDAYEIEILKADNVSKTKFLYQPLIVNKNTMKHFTRTNIFNRQMKAICCLSGFDFKPLKYGRQSFASNTLSLGAPLYSVANDLGHKSPTILEDHYAKFIPNKPSSNIIDNYFENLKNEGDNEEN